MSPEAWIGYALPALGIAFGLAGLMLAWLSAKRFDAQFGDLEIDALPVRDTRVSPYRKRNFQLRHGKPGLASGRS